MNDFDHRWKQAAAAARAAGEEPSVEVPFGFATRVVAQWQSAPAPSPVLLWQRLAWRVLGGLTLALAVLIILNTAFTTPDDPLSPDLGDTVSEAFWLHS